MGIGEITRDGGDSPAGRTVARRARRPVTTSETPSTTAAELSPEDHQRALGALAEIFLTDEGIADPYSRYAVLHEVAPVLPSLDGSLILSRFDDCQALLRDNRFGKNFDPDREVPGTGENDSEVIAFRRKRAEEQKGRPQSMLGLNPPEHTRIRGLVSRAFTPRRVDKLRGHIEDLAEERFDVMAELGEFDVLEELGFPLPVAVIGELVGVPREDWPSFRSSVTAMTATLEAGAGIEDLRAADTAGREVWEYFIDLVAEKRKNPADDLMSGMIEATFEEDGDRLNDDEIIAQAVLMFAAGFETTTNLIGNGVAALLTHPDEFTKVRADPGLVPSAVEEILRWDSPVQLDGRSSMELADVAGRTVEPNQRVLTLLGAANRDPLRFTDPDRFDVTRDEGAPMSFASGIHFCLGANLARVEGQVVLEGLIRRFSSIELNGELHQRKRMTLRGYEAVPVTVVPA